MRVAPNAQGKIYMVERGSCEISGWWSNIATGKLSAADLMDLVYETCYRKHTPLYDTVIGKYSSLEDAKEVYQNLKASCEYRETLGQRGARYTKVDYIRLTEITLDDEGDEDYYEQFWYYVAMPDNVGYDNQ